MKRQTNPASYQPRLKKHNGKRLRRVVRPLALPSPLYASISQAATASGLSMSEFVSNALCDFFRVRLSDTGRHRIPWSAIASHIRRATLNPSTPIREV